MKQEDFINRYMEVNQDEEIYDLHKRYTEFGPEDDDVYSDDAPKEEGDIGYWFDNAREDQLRWLQIRNFGPRMMPEGFEFLWVEEEWKKNYDFIRKYLEKYTNPLGGYVYRRNAYLGYNQTMGLLIPSGFKIHSQETHNAWNGNSVSPLVDLFKPEMRQILNAMGMLNTGWSKRKVPTPWYHGGMAEGPAYSYKASEFQDKYVFIYSDYYDYGAQWIEMLVGALLHDMYNLRIRKPLINSRVRIDSGPYLKGIKLTQIPEGFAKYRWPAPKWSKKFDDPTKWFRFIRSYESHYTVYNTILSKTVFNFAWLLGEIQMFLTLAKEYRSLIPYPVFPNFGFMGTVPSQIIDSNWFTVCDILDGYFKIPEEILIRDAKFFDDPQHDLGGGKFPTRPASEGDSEPYNPKGYLKDIV